jgi:hypothetical protein
VSGIGLASKLPYFSFTTIKKNTGTSEWERFPQAKQPIGLCTAQQKIGEIRFLQYQASLGL